MMYIYAVLTWTALVAFWALWDAWMARRMAVAAMKSADDANELAEWYREINRTMRE